MRLDESQALLDSAAEAAMLRIRRDRQSAPPKIQPLLAHLEWFLFDPGLNVTEWYRACGYRDHTVSSQFRQALGQPPKDYLEDCRLETASRLLLRTRLPISEIGYLVGYSSPKVFGRAFDRWQGVTAAAYRQQHSEDEQLTSPPGELLTTAYLRRAIRGQLPEDEARLLADRLRSVYPSLRATEEPSADDGLGPRPVSVDGRDFEDFMAEREWRRLRTLSADEQQAYVRHRIAFRSPAFFELLLRKSREEGRKDRQRGVRLAELALASVDGSAETLKEDPANLRARAWAWIGNAKRLALDFEGAEIAFNRADRHCAFPGSDEQSLAKAEVLDLKAALRLDQRRMQDALELSNLAVPLLREANVPFRWLESRVGRADILCELGDLDAAIEECELAIRELQALGDWRLQAAAESILATASALKGESERAFEALERANLLLAGSDSQGEAHYLRWIGGLVHASQREFAIAERDLCEAREGFLRSDATWQVLGTSLDLATLYSYQQRHEASIEMLSQLLPVLQGLRLEAEVGEALSLVERASAASGPRTELLLRIRQAVRGAIKLPAMIASFSD